VKAVVSFHLTLDFLSDIRMLICLVERLETFDFAVVS
jgi:hypothetical protein